MFFTHQVQFPTILNDLKSIIYHSKPPANTLPASSKPCTALILEVQQGLPCFPFHSRQVTQTRPRGCKAPGSSTLSPSHTGAASRDGQEAHPHLGKCGEPSEPSRRCRFLQLVSTSGWCEGESLSTLTSTWTTHNSTLSVPLEPPNIFLIALGLQTYFASKEAALGLQLMLIFQKHPQCTALLHPGWRNIPASFQSSVPAQ